MVQGDSSIVQAGRIKIVVGLALVAGSAISLYLYFTPRPPLPEPLLHEGIGRVLVQQAAPLAGPGGRITLIRRDTSMTPNPATEAQVRGVVAAARQAGLVIGTTNTLRLDPLRLVRVAPNDFLDWLRRQKEGDVIISLLGPPLLGPAQRKQLGEHPAPVVALCSGDMPRQVDLKALFEMGLLHAAVVDRPDPPMVPPKSKDPQSWFDAYYQVITRDNLNDLPSPSPSLQHGNHP